jgi:hypothetical protein
MIFLKKIRVDDDGNGEEEVRSLGRKQSRRDRARSRELRIEWSLQPCSSPAHAVLREFRSV